MGDKILITIIKLMAIPFLFFYELIRYPKLFFLRRFIWRKHRRLGWLRRPTIISYELDKEEILTRRYLLKWFLKPRVDQLQVNIDAIMNAKAVRYHLLVNNKILPDAYDKLTNAIKTGRKHSWEAVIEIIEDLTFHYEEICEMIRLMTSDKNGHVRETALLIMEHGNFASHDIESAFNLMINDRNKKVRERVADLIIKNKKFYQQYKNIIVSRLEITTDMEEQESLRFCLEYGDSTFLS